MKRRGAAIMVATAPLGCVFMARAQPSAVPVIGFLNSGSAPAWADLLVAFRQGLKETGHVEGQNVMIDYRWAEGHYDRLPGLASELVGRRVALIVATGGPPPIRAAMAATTAIPIVFTSGADPVQLGFVASLGRPGGNATGVALFTGELVAKRIELLRELVPNATTVVLFMNPNNPVAPSNAKSALAALQSLGLRGQVEKVRDAREMDAAFAALVQGRAAAAVVLADPVFETRRAQLVSLAARHAMPAIYPWREDVQAGGLISYGPSIADMYRQAGVYAGRILKGALPGTLPVLQPTRIELVINLKTAKALGLSIPQSLLVRADEVIQ